MITKLNVRGVSVYMLHLPSTSVAFLPLTADERRQVKTIIEQGFPVSDQFATFQGFLHQAILKATPDWTLDDVKRHVPDSLLPAVWNAVWSVSESFSVVDGQNRLAV